ncbi:uncharacterized protein LOC116851126 [Odontomachus brunneus]|uniref:uncharacterized protein LOC116851126 n=1 Tax=Odontomachus brunneus TaxID=486640 RepID=UPI0013F242FE|nr:uncharacterized protein LOC116851126 [Odontomachus brunneus]XP_032686108.1 uncharacterized protein LOC116851126 [Odontomachus brunneus]
MKYIIPLQRNQKSGRARGNGNAMSLVRRFDAANFRIPFRISRIATLAVIAAVLFAQLFAGSVAAARQVSSSNGGKRHHSGRCSARRSMGHIPLTGIVGKELAITPQDVLSRLETAAILRDHFLAALGHVLLLCLEDDASVPFKLIHDMVRTRQVAAYDLLNVLPMLRGKTPLQQLYKLLQMLERVGSRFVSEYASLCINAFPEAGIERALLDDILTDMDHSTLEAISLDKRRPGEIPLSLQAAMNFLLRAARNNSELLNLRTASAMLLNYPSFDFTDPEVPGAVRFAALQMKERSRSADPLLEYMEPNLESAEDFLRAVLERFEVDELSSEIMRETVSLLLQNLGVEPFSVVPAWKNDSKKILTMITYDRYPLDVVIVAKSLADHLDDSFFQDLDIGFYESGEHALLQVLSRLREKSNLQELRKPLSLLISFVSQRLMNEAVHDYATPMSFHEVINYLDSFDTPCLQQKVKDAMQTLRSLLTEDLPWTYAFGDRRESEDPRELTLTSLIRLRNVPMSKPQANAIDDVIYKSRVHAVTGKRGQIYDYGVVFQRDDSTNVEVDLFSLLMRIPDAFRSENFAPMLNFLSKPNFLDLLGREFNKFEYETPRSLLSAMLKRALALSPVKSDESLFRIINNARNYLEEPLLVNLYTTEDLQQLLKNLPGIDSDPRYLPLKILFKKQKLLAYLSSTFSIAGVNTPTEILLLILRTVALKVTQPKLAEALSFALDSFDGPPLPPRPFDHDDFVYLLRQLLPHNKALRNEILNSPVYAHIGDWNVSISGTPETVLARALSYPVKQIANNSHLAYVVKRAESIMSDKGVVDVDILKESTLNAMVEYLPSSTYAKPVSLLLKKASLMTLVPQVDLATLEAGDMRDALITLLKALAESPMIRAEKLLLRRIRAVLSSLDGVADNSTDHQTPILAYLVQSLQDPSSAVYEPLLSHLKTQNVTIPPEERQVWLELYLRRIIDENTSENLKKAATMALKEIVYDENSDEKTRASKTRIEKAVSFLPVDFFTTPLRKLLTPDWVYSILPEDVRKSDILENEELLLAILHHVKQRSDIADNPALMKVIFKVEMKLNGWRTNVESLRRTVAAVKDALYDPVKNLLTVAGLSKIKVTVPVGKSPKAALLELLHTLLSHTVIQRNNKVSKLLSAVRQDVMTFGVDVDLLTVLDKVGIGYTSELAPIRRFLHKKNTNNKIVRTVFAVANPEKQYRALLKVLQQQRDEMNNTRFLDALSTLKNTPITAAPADVLLSDLIDIVNTIPNHVRQRYKSIEYLFNSDILSRLTYDNGILESDNPLSTLLFNVAGLPEIRDNYTVTSKLKAMLSEIERLNIRQTVTGAQLKPLLLELRHVQQINVDFLNHVLEPEMLSYLNLDDRSVMTEDNAELLRIIIDSLLDHEAIHVDVDMRRHLLSFKKALMLTMNVDTTTSKSQLTDDDWKMMLSLVSHKKDFAPIKIFLQSEEVLKYIPENMNWKLYTTPAKKLLYLLSLIENDEIENRNVHRSAKRLRENLEKRFNFVTEEDVRSMHRTLASLDLKYDLVPLKIFLNHDNMIKYLPSNFKYGKYSTPIHALVVVLDNLLQVPSLKRRVLLYKTMTFTRQSLIEQTQSRRSLSSNNETIDRLSTEDLSFVSLFNTSSPMLREFLDPRTLLSLLPESFNFHGRPTFKTKALYLLRQLLRTNTDLQVELEALLREVLEYPDVPIITKDDLEPILKIIPTQGIPHIELVKKYLKPSVLVKLLPGTFDPKRAINVRTNLHDILLLLDVTLGSKKTEKAKIAIHALIDELKKIIPTVILEEAAIDANDVRSIILEIPFKRYKRIEQMEAQMTTKKVIAALPANFELTKYKTKKLRLLAILDELSKSESFRSSADSINFMRRIVRKMPDMPKMNDTEIEKMLLQLPLRSFYVKHLVTNCRLNTLVGYLPISFDLNILETRKTKIAKILHYCKLANPVDISTKQALTNAEALLNKMPDFDVTQEHVRALIRTIPCTHFTSIKPLLRYLSKVDVTSLLSWDLDVYKVTTFKERVLDLLTALKNTHELQNDKMFSALDALQTNVWSMPDKVNVSVDYVNKLKAAEGIVTDACKDYRELVMTTQNLEKILPPNYSFSPERTVQHEWSLIVYFSKLFLREVRLSGPVKNAFEATVNLLRDQGRTHLLNGIREGLQQEPFKQLIPMRLYTLGHENNLTGPIEDVYRGYFHGSLSRIMRVALKEFIRRPDIIKSKSLMNDLEVFLHDYVILHLRDYPSNYEMRQAIDEIPSEQKYDDLRLLMQCQDMQESIAQQFVPEDGTSKQLLFSMLELAANSPVDLAIREAIASLKPIIQRDIRQEEAELVLKQMRDYRYHMGKVEAIRSHIVNEGLQAILVDYRVKYPTFRERLVALSDTLQTTLSANVTNELREASDYLKRVLNNELKIEHVIPRTIDDINVQTLFFALPKTRDERIIRGIIRFFSIPNLLRELKLPKNPFEYVTKGQLLQALMDLGQGLRTVQEDLLQQEALEYFRDKILKTGPGAQPIELKKYAANSNMHVDMYGVMRAIDYDKMDEAGAVKVAMFFENKYNNLVHAVGFDHLAYATRGSYLKALFEHLVNVSQISDDVKQQMSMLIPLVKLDGPGDESVDLNDDIAPATRIIGEFPEPLDSMHGIESRFFGLSEDTTKLPYSILKKKESLETAVHDMLENIASSEEDGKSGDSAISYHEKTHAAVSERSRNVTHEITRQKSSSSSKRTSKHRTQQQVRNTMEDSDSSFEKTKENKGRPKMAGHGSTKVPAENRADVEVDEKNDQSTEESSSSDNVSSGKYRLEYVASSGDERSRAKSDSSSRETRSSGLSYVNVEIDDSNMSDRRIVKPLPVASRELPTEKTPRKSYALHRESRKSINRRLFIRPDSSTDIEFEDNSDHDNVTENAAPDLRMFRDTLRKNEENLSLTKELIDEKAKKNSTRKAGIVKKDLGRKRKNLNEET